MKYIQLNKEFFVIIDDDDYDIISQWKWFVKECRNKNFYAHAYMNGKFVLIHRFLLNPLKDMEIDHIDNNGLNNQRYNLRIVTKQQNLWNSDISQRNTSGYKGVCFDKQMNKYRARIMHNFKSISLGLFELDIDAALAYDEYARKFRGEFAKTNF